MKVACLSFLLGCGSVEEGRSGDADTDVDSDADSDGDTDSESETGSASDTASDTTSDTEPGCAVDCGDPSLATCIAGECVCQGALIDCDEGPSTDCFDATWLDADPSNCGLCGRACAASEYCADGDCDCRPGLRRCGDACVDVYADSSNCGDCGLACAGAAVTCDRGVCENSCEAGEESCLGGCILATDTHPLCCGTWPDYDACDVDELCVDDVCVPFTIARGCDDCGGCDACRAGFEICCPYPGAAGPLVCVAAAACPVAF